MQTSYSIEIVPTYAWLSKVVWTPLSLAAWALAWNRWNARAVRAIDGAILLLTLVGIAGALMKLAPMTQIFRLGVLALFAVIAVRMVRHGPMRNLAIATLVTILVSQYAGELGSLGVPTIWFPFGIGVTLTQYVYALAIPLLAVLIVRTTPSTKAR